MYITVNWLHADIPLFFTAKIGNSVLLKPRNVIEALVILILFSLDMVLVYDLAHRRNDVEKNGTEYFSRENMLIILFF
jgi:hypothetical protein